MHAVAIGNVKGFGKWSLPLACMAGLLLTTGTTALAAVLAPGGTVYPVGNGAGFQYPGGGESYITTIDSPVEYVSQPIGGGAVYDLRFQIVTQIYQSATGTIDFVYQLDNTSDNNQTTTYGDSVLRLTLQSFEGYMVNADDIAGSGNAAPVSADRSTDGSVVGFNFQGYDASNNYDYTQLIPGATSDDLVVRTDATSWGLGTASVIGGNVGDVTVQVPYGSVGSEGVPEPTSLCMASVAGLSLLARRKKAAL